MILNEHIGYDSSSILPQHLDTISSNIDHSMLLASMYLEVTPSFTNFHVVMCRRRFIIQEIIIDILLYGGG
jgi:hypothetical protein